MSKPIKTASGKWWVQFKASGVRESGTFDTRREADEWQAARRLELKKAKAGKLGELKTLGDALEKFRDEVSPSHKGERWEALRLDAMLRHPSMPARLPLAQVTPDHLLRWRDARLADVSAGSVLRDMNLLGSVLSHAVREWRWIATSPLAEVRRPKSPKHRERIITWAEVRAMLRQLGYRPGQPPASMTAMVGYAFMIALRTGMRDSEITGLTWDRVQSRWVSLPQTKNGDSRDVPLSRKAARLVQLLRGIDPERVFIFGPGVRDTIFRRARERAGLTGFTFHDARHAAATRIGATVGQPGRLSFPEFVKVFGWRDPKHALIYCNPSAAMLADKL